MTEPINPTASAVRELRTGMKRTQGWMAARLGVDKGTVHRFEKGKLMPSSRLLMKMARIAINNGRQEVAARLVEPVGVELEVHSDCLMDGIRRAA